jgi:hypothetical protein
MQAWAVRREALSSRKRCAFGSFAYTFTFCLNSKEKRTTTLDRQISLDTVFHLT